MSRLTCLAQPSPGRLYRSSKGILLRDQLSDRLIVRSADGSHMGTRVGMHTELTRALDFPVTGDNWDAIEESLASMDWFYPNRTIVLSIAAAERVLVDEPRSELAKWRMVLEAAQAECAEFGLSESATGKVEPVALQVVLHIPDSIWKRERTRWRKAGFEVRELET